MSRLLFVLVVCSVALSGCSEKDGRGRALIPASEIAGGTVPSDPKAAAQKDEFEKEGMELLGMELYKGSTPAPGVKKVFRNSQVEGDHYAVTMLASADLSTLKKFFKAQLRDVTESEIEIPEYDQDFKSLGNKPYWVLRGTNKEGNKVFVNIATSMTQGKTKYGIDTLHALGSGGSKSEKPAAPDLP